MANNLMLLKNKTSGKSLKLFKYYPMTGWYLCADKERINSFLEEHSEHLQWGNTDFVLEYEHEEKEPGD